MLLIFVLLAGCSPATALPVVTLPPVSAPTFPPTLSATSTPRAPTLWIHPAVPQGMRDLVPGWHIPVVESQERATVQLAPASAGSTWIYALVAPFPTVADSVTGSALQAAWKGTPAPPIPTPLLLSSTTLAALSSLWGQPAAQAVQVMSDSSLLDAAWQRSLWAVIPFDEIQPRWKVIALDGQSPLHKDFDATVYPLQVHFQLSSGSFDLPASNRDPDKLATVILTGVTAIVRATAATMELKGVTYPGELLRDWFRQADIIHISNEVTFDPDCPKPRASYHNFLLCSDPRYMDLLLDVGVDVVELSGDHLRDRGDAALLNTLAIYRQHGIPYYGGGTNAAEARKPALFEVNGNKIAFLGCNGKRAVKYPKAGKNSPGPAVCDFDDFAAQIKDLKAQGYQVIFTFQHEECYSASPCYTHEGGFHKAADSGAVVVSGSQAHYPQIMEFYGSSFLHYGLGNLFFDQMTYTLPGGEVIDETRREFYDRHVFYDGRYLGVELLTGILEDYSRPRPMTPVEREAFLSEYFYQSGWSPRPVPLTPLPTVTLTPIALP